MNIVVYVKKIHRKEASRKERRTISDICKMWTKGMNEPLTKEMYV